MVTKSSEAIARLERLRSLADELGGPDRVQRHHDRGLLTAIERVDLLLDPGSKLEFGKFVHSGEPGQEERTMGDALLVGFGTVGGRQVAYSANDATIKGATGGAGSRRRGASFHKIVEDAGIPLFELIQGGGIRISDVFGARVAGLSASGIGKRLAFPRRHTVIGAVMGNYYAPWSAADADYCIMTQGSNIAISSPAVIEEATGLKTDPLVVGGAPVHARVTGQIDDVVADDAAAVARLREVFSYLPASPWDEPPKVLSLDPADRRSDALRSIVPEQPNRAYDVRSIIRLVVDQDSFLEWMPAFAPNIAGGIARIDGQSVIIIANQPLHRAGCIDVGACIKLKRLFTTAERFSLPIVSFIDTPGVLPTPEQERARLLAEVYALAVQRVRLHVPKINVVLRKSYGFAAFVMNGFDKEWYTFAWPSAQIAFMGPEPSVRVVFRREWERATDPDAYLREQAEIIRRQAEPWEAAELGYIEDVIDPAVTRETLVRALEVGRARMRRTRRDG